MKAEQRKELETNTLADKMGQVVQRVKGSPRRTFVIYLLVTVAVLASAWFGWRWYVGKRVEESQQWVQFYDGSRKNVIQLAAEEETNVGKAARFQIAWILYWEEGVKQLGRQKDAALKSIKSAEKIYGELAEKCKDDASPVFKLQALLGQAVATETLAVEDPDNLKRATKYYEVIVNDFGKDKEQRYAEVKFAQERLDILKDNVKGQALTDDYQKIRSNLGIARMDLPEGFGKQIPK